MKSIKRYIYPGKRKNRDTVLTEVAVKSAYATRGYLAYGGEWLTLPLMLMLAEVARSVGDVIRFLFGKEDGYGSDGD